MSQLRDLASLSGPPTLDCPLRSTTNKPCILDPDAYPGIVDLILGHADAKTRLALWSTHPALQERLNADYYAHAVKKCGGLVPHTGIFPQMFRDVPIMRTVEVLMHLTLHCRVFDLESSCDLSTANFLLKRGRVQTLRSWNSVDISSLTVPPTVVLKCNCLPSPEHPDHWLSVFDLTPPGAPPTERLVYNVAYAWADAIFASTMGITTLPESVKELVIHFKHIPTPRPRYTVCETVGFGTHKVVGALTATDPVPPLLPNEHLDPIDFPLPFDDMDLFARIAKLYRPGLKLTLVGVDEFDAARDADASGDAEWDTVCATLPWFPTVPQVTRPKYVAMADTFRNLVLKGVPKKKRDKAKRDIKVITSAEYFEGGKHGDEADWWASGEVPQAC
jgi:hypothetical protein